MNYIRKQRGQYFPGRTVVNTLCFHCRGRFPGWGTKIPYAVGPANKKSRWQYCKVISFQLIKINEKKKKEKRDGVGTWNQENRQPQCIGYILMGDIDSEKISFWLSVLLCGLPRWC